MFNPNQYLTKLKGKDYLEVKWRLVWFRDQHPQGVINTSMVHLDIDKGIAVFKASVDDGDGGHAEGHGSETSKDFGDYIEKAETKSIGRALAALGYGTQFAPELEEGERVVDSPVARTSKPETISSEKLNSLFGRGKKANLFTDVKEFSSFIKEVLGLDIPVVPRQLTEEQGRDLEAMIFNRERQSA